MSIKKLNEYKVNILMVVGDVIAGKNYFNGGGWMMNVELETQKDACAYLLAYIKEQVPTLNKIWIWDGTPYHDSMDTSIAKSVTEKLASQYGILADYMGEYKYITLKFNGYERILWVTHPSTLAGQYPEQVMARDIKDFLASSASGKIIKPDMIIRAHRHEYIEIHKSTIRSIILPCWQFYIPFDKALKSYSSFQPDIGGVILLADDELRLRPWHFTYPNITEPERFLTLTHEKELSYIFLTIL